jgi:arylsulfatase A-like enzyme
MKHVTSCALFVVVLLPGLLASGCGEPAALAVDMPLHLEDHVAAARMEGPDASTAIPTTLAWSFAEPQPEWKPAYGYEFSQELVTPAHVGDGLRITLEEKHVDSGGDVCGYIYTDLPPLAREDWGSVVVRARAHTGVNLLGVGLDLTEPTRGGVRRFPGVPSPVVDDGTVQTYRLDAGVARRPSGYVPRQLVMQICADPPLSTFDLLSLTVAPREASYAAAPAGVVTELLGGVYRRALYTHAPGALTYDVRVPDGARLDLGLRVIRPGAPVTFRVRATHGGVSETRLEERISDPERWAQRSVDLSDLAGQVVSLALEADAERAGTVALWAAPTLSSTRATDAPNVIFYIIDGGGADYMSVYGYNRRTTPNLERLAAEGAVFERAYSNSSWTLPSTASFLTSLQQSVLGALPRDPVPEQVATLAEHMHRAGYQTAEFTSNPNAGGRRGLQRGNDMFRDTGVEPNHSISSVVLQDDFWRWRTEYPGEPYWVHFQTTDVHSDHQPVAPFAGLFISAERRRLAEAWDGMLAARLGGAPHFFRGAEPRFQAALEESGIGRVEYYAAQRDLHDETMAHQDYQLGQLVARLQASGEWERTLLIVAADHSVSAGAEDFGVQMREILPPQYLLAGGPMFSPGVSHIPLIVVWPGHIAPGQRFSEPVSMIDMLPTILDLVDVPLPDVMQGQSLAPLLLGTGAWERRPVILDELQVRGSGELAGWIEVVDGRWAASLEINPAELPESARRPVSLLLFDLWSDPMCLHSVHEQHPDLVEKYAAFLEDQVDAHRALAQLFTPGEQAVALTPEQLETLRSLGYIR